MSVTAWPRPQDIFEYYRQMSETLRALDRQFLDVTADLHSRFAGMDRDEFDAAIVRLRDELDAQVVLALIASSEAVLLKDCDNRIHRKTRDPVRPHFQELYKDVENKGRKSLKPRPILRVWQEKSGKNKSIQHFQNLYKHRHWLAHGRHWSDKSGVTPDPAQTWRVIDNLFQALSSFLSDFPLL